MTDSRELGWWKTGDTFHWFSLINPTDPNGGFLCACEFRAINPATGAEHMLGLGLCPHCWGKGLVCDAIHVGLGEWEAGNNIDCRACEGTGHADQMVTDRPTTPYLDQFDLLIMQVRKEAAR